ncbi:MAG: hypothetical protein WCZ87_02285 [Thiohalobacteraceae bacterium]
MADSGRYDYIQTRLQARHGQRPTAATWQRLTALRDLSLFLQTARSSGLRPWLEGFAPDTPPHRMEQLLRQRFRAEAQLVASWQPRAWQAATAWIAHWIDLPALGGLLRLEQPPAWMREDPDYGPLAELPRAARGEAMSHSRWAALAPAAGRSIDLRRVWFARWRRLWPQQRDKQLELLATALQQQLPQGDATATSPAADAAAREHWRSWLKFRFRQHTRSPLTPMLYLFMLAQDVERLRGELLQRRLFPPPAEAA